MQARYSPFPLVFLVKNKTNKGEAAAPEPTLHLPGVWKPMWAELGRHRRGQEGTWPHRELAARDLCAHPAVVERSWLLGTQGNGVWDGLTLKNVSKDSADNIQIRPRSTARSQTQRPACCEDSGASGWAKAQEGNVENPSGGGRGSISSVTLGESPLGPISVPSGTWEVP